MKTVTYQDPSLSTYDIYEYGDGEGTEVVITSGIHGVEQTAIYVARQFVKYFEDHGVNGKVKIIPVCNQAAYFNRTRTSPYDQLDLNRIFPGDAHGSQSMQLAHSIWQDTRDADYIIDLHCCGQHGSTYVMSLFSQFEHQVGLAKLLGFSDVVHSGGARGQLFLEACEAGQQALLVELKGGQPDGMIDFDAAEKCFKQLLNFFKYTGNIATTNSDKIVETHPVRFHERMTTLKAEYHGLFVPYVNSGVHYEQGTILGKLNNENITAPFDCYIAAINYPRYCFAGERMVRIAQIKN